MKVLVIDNYDSFTYNIVQYLGELGVSATVWRNDQFTLQDVKNLNPERILLSPGPCTPSEAGLCLKVLQEFKHVPTLGVCLGHQSIGQAFGAKVVRAKHLMHGKISHITHNQAGIFNAIPQNIAVTRYHSLVVEDLPAHLLPTAWATESDGSQTLMALRHRDYPLQGVQFHPESIASQYGHAMFKNFLDAAC